MTGPGKIAINGHTENFAAVDFINIKFPVEIDRHFEVNFLFFCLVIISIHLVLSIWRDV